MNLLGSLIPGVREIRAPIVSGYLWCVCLWLVLEPDVPNEKGQVAYERIVDLAQAVGPFGRAVAVSIAAYLLGSLIQATVQVVWSWASGWLGIWRAGAEAEGRLFARVEDLGNQNSVDSLLSFASPFDRDWVPQPIGMNDPGLYLTIQELADRELSDSYRELARAVEGVQRRHPHLAVGYSVSGGAPIVNLPVRSSGSVESVEFTIPYLFAARDLFGQRSLLEMRLLEVAPTTGAQIERLHAEAEFRFAVALPLAVLAILLAFGVSAWWACGLGVPMALAIQGLQLSRQAIRELFDALRARVETPELQQITPVFERYRTFAARLSAALQHAD